MYDEVDCDSTDSLLHGSEHGTAFRSTKRSCKTFSIKPSSFFIVQLALLSLYTTVFFAFDQRCSGNLVYCTAPAPCHTTSFHTNVSLGSAPAASAVKKERVRFDATLVIESPFNGPPSTEVDAAWTALIDSTRVLKKAIFMASNC